MTNNRSTVQGRIQRWIAVLLASFAAMTLVSCDKPLKLQVVLDRDEAVTKGMPVYVDSIEAGKVTDVGNEGGERVADLAIRDKEVRARLCVGALRMKETGRIQINTDTVKEGARPLPHGARVPTASKIEYLVTKYSSKSTLVTVLIGIVALVVLWLVFRSLVGTVGMILCVVFASILTQVVHPYAVPWVERAMAMIGPPPAVESVQPGKGGEPPSSPAANATPSTAAVVRKAENTIIEVINARPSPVVVTWCAVFLALFIGLNLILGRVSRVWRK
ncbi:MAG: hypothetical protein WCK77_07590 [Verrucomicrobiota bacterium]